MEPVTLRAIDPARQGAAERLALLLERIPVDDAVTLRAAVIAADGGWWWVGDGGVAVRIDRLAGASAGLHPDRIAEVVAAFETAAPLLDAIESVTGWVVEPGAAVAEAPADAVAVALTASRNGTEWLALAIAVPTAMAAAAAQAAVDAALLRDVPLPARVAVRAADLSVEEAGALGPGDLLILPAGAWRTTLAFPAMGDVAAVLEPASGALVHAPAGHGREVRVDDDEPAATDRVRELRVPVAMRLPDAAVTAGELARLREGGTLPLGPVTAGLAVELSVGGRLIAYGEIVRLGDRFAVHVDRLAPVSAAAPIGEDD